MKCFFKKMCGLLTDRQTDLLIKLIYRQTNKVIHGVVPFLKIHKMCLIVFVKTQKFKTFWNSGRDRRSNVYDVLMQMKMEMVWNSATQNKFYFVFRSVQNSKWKGGEETNCLPNPLPTSPYVSRSDLLRVSSHSFLLREAAKKIFP